MLAKEGHGGSDRLVLDPVGLAGITELPTFGLASDQDFVDIAGEPGSGKDTAIVRAACPGAMRINRTLIVDKQRAVSCLVIAKKHLASRQTRRRKQQLRGNVRERLGLLGLDMNELG